MADKNNSSLANLWFLGVILATLASFISNLGLNIQKLLHLRNQNRPVDVRDGYYRYPLWWLGLSLIVFGAIADFAALTFAPQSLIAPLGSLTLVSNIILSPIILKEVVTTRDILATLTIVCGCIISVIFATHTDIMYTLDELFGHFTKWPFIMYATLVASFIIFCLMLVSHYESIESDPTRYTSRKETWHRIAYPAMSGTIGAQSVLFAKCLIEMIVNAFQNRGLFLLRWQAYFIILALVASIFLQIKWLNDGLLRFDASFEVPIFQAFWVLLSVISGLVFYQEYQFMSKLQLGLFMMGVTVTILGVILLSRGRKIHRPNAFPKPSEDDERTVCSIETSTIRTKQGGVHGYGWIAANDGDNDLDDDFDDDDDVDALAHVPLMHSNTK